jgi:hypothetical protein
LASKNAVNYSCRFELTFRVGICGAFFRFK